MLGLSGSKLSQFNLLSKDILIFSIFHREADLKPAWERYMTVVTECLLVMYHN